MEAQGLGPESITRCLVAMTFQRITIDPAVCTGKPCIRGLRFPAAVKPACGGETREAILTGCPYLQPEDIDEAATYTLCEASQDGESNGTPMG